MGMKMRILPKTCVAGLLMIIFSAVGSSGAMALVIPGTPASEQRGNIARPSHDRPSDNRRDYNTDVPSYYQEGNMIYSVDVERAPQDRKVRMSYRSTPAVERRAYRRSSPLEDARRRRRENETVYVSSSTPRTIRYRNPTYPAVPQRGSTGLRIPGRSETASSYPAPKRAAKRSSVAGATPAVASWYGWKFHGRQTANGETYNMYDHTAAHKTLPFGTLIRVTNLRTGRQKIVRINDRGPFIAGRDIDLSYATARDLGMLDSGVENVRLEILPG